jgi:hypothetical protein
MPATATDRLFGLTTSVAVKAPCHTVATSNITLSGLQTINGVTVIEGDRVLVTAQTSSVNNGIYLASSSTWQRAPDFDGARDAVQGTQVPITRNGAQTALYEVATANPITFGTTAILFTLRYSANLQYEITAAEIAALATPIDLTKKAGNIRRYFSAGVIDGTTDVAYAIRKALDVAAQDGTTVTCDPPGSIKVGGVIYIPQNVGGGHREMHLSFHGCTFVGQGKGTGTIFESGTGTVSTGGATNFGQTNESAASLHYALVIEGGFYTACQYAFRLFNCIYGTTLSDMRFEDVSHVLVASRCFASRYYNLDAQIVSVTAGDVLFDFAGLTNAIVVQGCSAAGGAANTTGIGFSFGTGGGIVFQGNTAEELDTGLVLGPVLGGLFKGNYFEGITTRAIDATSSSNREMDIGGNWFLSVGQAINAVMWISGTWESSNHLQGTATVVVNDLFSFCTVEIPPNPYSELNHTTWTAAVSGYTLSTSVNIRRADFIYSSGAGFVTKFARMGGFASTDNLVPLAYAGTGGTQVTGMIPLCTTSVVASNSLQIDTKIAYAQAASAEFTVQVIDSVSTYVVSGKISYGAVLPRFDATAKTVTPSNNGGLLRITLGGFVTISSYNGSVRIV